MAFVMLVCIWFPCTLICFQLAHFPVLLATMWKWELTTLLFYCIYFCPTPPSFLNLCKMHGKDVTQRFQCFPTFAIFSLHNFLSFLGFLDKPLTKLVFSVNEVEPYNSCDWGIKINESKAKFWYQRADE